MITNPSYVVSIIIIIYYYLFIIIPLQLITNY